MFDVMLFDKSPLATNKLLAQFIREVSDNAINDVDLAGLIVRKLTTGNRESDFRNLLAPLRELYTAAHYHLVTQKVFDQTLEKFNIEKG